MQRVMILVLAGSAIATSYAAQAQDFVEERIIRRPVVERRIVRRVEPRCEVIVRKRVNRFGERVVIRERVCD